MSKELYLKEFFCIDETTLFNRLNEDKKQRVVDWDKYIDCKIPIDKLPNQDLIKEFIFSA